MTHTVEVVVGVVGRPHGIRGELGVDVRTDEPTTRFASGTRLHAEGEPHRTWQVLGHRWHQDRLLVRLEGVDDRTTAEALRGTRLAATVPASQTPDDAAEFYDHQLVGLTVESAGRSVGTVVEVVHLPAQDLLAVEVTVSGERRLVPFVEALVPEVDLPAGRLVLADVPGLLVDIDDDPPGADDRAATADGTPR